MYGRNLLKRLAGFKFCSWNHIHSLFSFFFFSGFTMYTTCVIWLAFVPLYFGTGNHVPLRITSMSVTISLSASVTLACLFSPKLYIILVHPERNVRQSMMPVSLYLRRISDNNTLIQELSWKIYSHTACQEILFFYGTWMIISLFNII